MTDGLGAGFFALTVLATLAFVAVVLATAGVVGSLVGADRDRIPPLFQYVAVGLLGVVVAVAGFAVLSVADESPVVAALLAGVVGLPLLAVLLRGRTTAPGSGRVAVAAAAALAWSLPFLASVGVLFALTVATDLPPAVTGPITALVVVAGTLVVNERVLALGSPAHQHS